MGVSRKQPGVEDCIHLFYNHHFFTFELKMILEWDCYMIIQCKYIDGSRAVVVWILTEVLD